MNKEIQKELDILLKEEIEEFMRESHRIGLRDELINFIYDKYIKKDSMFQCIIDGDVKVDTGLISFNEANDLWEDYYEYCSDGVNYQIGIYTECLNSTDYSNEYKIEDSRY